MTIAESIRAAIQQAVDNGVSLNSIATDTGIQHAGLHRWFTHDTYQLRSENFQRLADHFGMHLTKPRKNLRPRRK